MMVIKKYVIVVYLWVIVSPFVFSTQHTEGANDKVTGDLQKKMHSIALAHILLPVQQQPLVKPDTVFIPRYEAGQGNVSFGLGALFPLFFQRYTGEIADTNLSVGGHVWFEWGIFLWQGLSTGMEISGIFSLTPNSRTLFIAPITVNVKYTFQLYPVEFPISLAFGMSLSSLEQLFKVDPIFKPKVGITYRINQNWSVGLFTSYWLIIQTYATTLGDEYSRLGNFIDTTAGVSYVF